MVGDARTWSADSLDWLESAGVHVVRANDHRCHQLFADWLADNPDSWVGAPRQRERLARIMTAAMPPPFTLMYRPPDFDATVQFFCAT
jgi:hypothetical protein